MSKMIGCTIFDDVEIGVGSYAEGCKFLGNVVVGDGVVLYGCRLNKCEIRDGVIMGGMMVLNRVVDGGVYLYDEYGREVVTDLFMNDHLYLGYIRDK